MRPNGTVGKLPLAKVIGLAAETKTARAGLVARADGWLEAVWCAGWESAAWKPPQRDPASTYQPIGMAAGVNGLGDANLEKLWSVASVFASWKAFPPSAVASPASLRGGAATTLARCPNAATGDLTDDPDPPDKRRRPRTEIRLQARTAAGKRGDRFRRLSRKDTEELGTIIAINGSIKVQWDGGRTSYFRHGARANIQLPSQE